MTARPQIPLRFRWSITAAMTLALVAVGSLTVRGDEPGRGLTGRFEVNFLKMAIDHHYSALRMTELAAGTDLQRGDSISGEEGTSPSPGFATTEPHSESEEIKSMAREANRMQREEILTAQRWLKEWYGITYEPRLTAEGRAGIAILNGRQGEPFDHKFLEVFSRHHYPIIQRSVDCVVGSDLGHDALKRYCRTIIEAQMNGIENMRHMLCRMFGICDFLPFSGDDGKHSRD